MSNMILLAVSGRRIIRIDEKEFPKTSGENSVVLNAFRKIEHIEIKSENTDRRQALRSRIRHLEEMAAK